MMASRPRSWFAFWSAATVVYSAALAWLMHEPPGAIGTPPWWRDFPHSDKVVHAVLYAGLAGLLSITVRSYRARRDVDDAAQSGSPNRVLFAALAAYCAVDELTQPLTGRQCDIWDFAADMLGVSLGLLIAHLAGRRSSRR